MGKAKVGPRGGVYVLTKSGNKNYIKNNDFGITAPTKFSDKIHRVTYTKPTQQSCGCGK